MFSTETLILLPVQYNYFPSHKYLFHQAQEFTTEAIKCAQEAELQMDMSQIQQLNSYLTNKVC